jgi:pyridoxal phosphate enzyme (YggS family)
MNVDRLRRNIEAVRERIAQAAGRAGRSAAEVILVAVTKRSPPEVVQPLLDCQIADMGENYPQELWSKVEAVASAEVRWHLIGHLQGNKARRTLPIVQMIHAVDSMKLLDQLDHLATEMTQRPRLCLQVNCSGETTKHGWSPEQLLADAESIARTRGVEVAGLMTMAALGPDSESARPAFTTLREVRDQLRARTNLVLPELSMGMSGDFDVAIEEGATLVRIGSALFEGVMR